MPHSSTKLYHHYKKKPYKYLGLARHSETLEEMVIYEALYPNELGKVWVRPRDMFFETIQKAGMSRPAPRFAKIEIELKASEDQGQLQWLGKAVFPTDWKNRFSKAWEVSSNQAGDFASPARSNRLTFALVEGTPVAFMIGQRETADDEAFRISLCGVLPEYRGLGIATALLERLREHCRAEGLARLVIQVEKDAAAPLLFSLKGGFSILSMENGQITLEKTA
ncbi:MAG: GNAT family N-acetyltransferase [Methylotenera sp.]|nr:GNAT family N-acetyltransferase [Oligoflexia bacterium]